VYPSDTFNFTHLLDNFHTKRLDMAFGGGADTWLRLQAAYDLAQARRKAAALDIKRYEPA
jgi:plasmid maintenance system antidote protein VapI